MHVQWAAEATASGRVTDATVLQGEVASRVAGGGGKLDYVEVGFRFEDCTVETSLADYPLRLCLSRLTSVDARSRRHPGDA